MIKYLIEGIEETFGSQEEANAYIAALGPGVSVQLISDDIDQANNEITAEDTILNPDFLQDAAEGADVVSGPLPAPDTGSASGEGSLDLPSIEPLQQEEDWSFWKETKKKIKANTIEALGNLARIPTFLNEIQASISREFLTEEEQEKYDSLDPETKQILANIAGPQISAGNLANIGLEKYKKSKEEADKIREDLTQFETSIGEEYAKGNFVEATVRTASDALGSIPSVIQSMIPYVGIASIFAGEAAAASGRIQEEGEDLTLKNIGYSTVIGASEGLLEATTRKIGLGMFKGLAGKPKGEVVKSLKDVFLGIGKEYGEEGLSESATLTINNMADALILGKEDAFEDYTTELVDTFLVGGAMGGGMSSVGAARTGARVARTTLEANSVKKDLNNTQYENLADAYKLPDVPEGLGKLTENKYTEKFLDNELKQKVDSGEITINESNDIKNNFKETQTATRKVNEANITETYKPEIIEKLVRKNKLDKQIKGIDDDALNAPLKKEVKDLNTQITELQIASIQEQAGTKEKVAVEKLKKVAKDFNVEISEVDQEGANKIRSEIEGKPKESTAYGFIYTDKNNTSQIVLNKDQIFEDAKINTGAHEFLHFALNETLKSTDKEAAFKTLASSVGDLLLSSELLGNVDKFNSRLEQYQSSFEKGDISSAQLAEEQLVILSEAMLDGEFKVKETTISKLKDIVRRFLSTIGVKAEFNTDQDVLNFIKDYNRSISKGKLTRGQKKTIKEGAKGKLITPKTTTEKTTPTKKSMSNKMSRLLERQEALVSMEGIMDAAELDVMKQEMQQEIDELKIKEGKQAKAVPTKTKPKKLMTLEEADEAYEDALEAWNEAPDNDALEARVEKALNDVAAAKERFDAGEEAVAETKVKAKPVEKPVRKKKDRSTKRYTLTDEAKAKIEPLIEKAQKMNKELIAEEKKLNDEKIAKIRSTPETEMSRTEQAKAVLQAKANPIRLPKSAELRRIETEIQDRVEKPLGKAVTFFTKLLYDKIPAEAANVIGGRDAYKSAAEARILNIVINEFKKETVNRQGEKTINDIEDIIFNRGGLRLLTLATDLGVADARKGITGTIDERKVRDYGDWNKAFDDNPVKMDVDGMFRVSSLLGDSARMEQAMEQVAEFWKDNIGNSAIENFKKLPSLVDNIVADMFNISENVLTARSGNLNTQDYTNALKAITKPYAVYKVEGKDVRVATEFAEELENRLKNEGKSFERFADQNILQTLFKFLPKLSADDYRYADRTKGRYSGKATGIPKNLVKLTYSGLERGTTGMGNMKARVSKVAYEDVLAAMGGIVNKDGVTTKLPNVSGRTPEGQTLLGVIKLMNRMITNDISRNSNLGLDPMTMQDIAAGKNDLMMSLKQSPGRPLQVRNPILQEELNNFYSKNPKATNMQQLNYINADAKKLGIKAYRIFNWDIRNDITKNDPDSIEAIEKIYGKAWGKAYNYIVEDISFKEALNDIQVDSSKENLENFFVLYARALKNKKYEGAKNNTTLWNLVGKTIGKGKLEELGFRLRKADNMSFIEVEVAKGVYETISAPLNIDTIKQLAKADNFNITKINEIGDVMFDDSIRYINLVLNHIDKLINSNQYDRAIADIHTMGLGQLTPIRKMSNLGTVYKFEGPGILEHAESVKLIQNKLIEYANDRDRAKFETYISKQKVNVIPKEADPKQRVGTEAEKYSEKEVQKILTPLERITYNATARRKKLKLEENAENANKSFNNSLKRSPDTKRKGISVLDFDDTLARTNSKVLYTMPNGTTGKLNAEQFAKDGDRLMSEGAEFDFSEFSKVIDGEKGPLFEKTKDLIAKFGNKNVFILTARPANSKYAIHEFLSGLGLDIPLRNITGLADSNPQAKADWITGKAAEGYNDFFFADDYVKNITAVGKALKAADVKSKTVLAAPDIKFSSKVKGQPKLIKDLVDVFDVDGEGQSLLDKATRTLDLQWNELYKNVTGIDPDIEFGDVEAQKLGEEVSKNIKSRARAITRGYLIESGADDFLGLLYRTLPKGKKGEAMMKLYEDNLLKPFATASREIEKARIKMAKRYRDIKVNNGISDKVLNGKIKLKTESGKDVTYTSEDAVRVYMWRKQGIEVPGLSEQNELDLAEHVKSSDELYSFTLNLMNNTLPDEFADPRKNWVTGSLKTDYLEGINKTKRKEALRFWEKGVETIFSESNLKKIKVQSGTKFVEALENSIERMRTGRNTIQSLDSDTKIMLQFISGAVGNIMFLNTRSAGLQLLSATNFMEAGDNNWGKSLKTIFTKMPTLAKDYKMLMNTDFLLDRRNALKMDVNDSDIARIAQGKGLQGKLARFLQWGYVFTQAADSRAIALGGAVYYRNTYDKLIAQGVDPKVAKEQALLETTEHAQASQQSSRADKISKQQASTAGRLMLAFANTPMQYNRIVQKAYLDLVNNRGSKRKNLYNMVYYGLAQNLLFTVAQGAMLTAVYGTLFGEDEEDDKLTYDQKVNVANGVLSSWLRGLGIWGNSLNALKQTFLNINKESKKKRPQYDVAAIKGLTSIMPAVGSKISKIYATTREIDYNKDFLFDVNDGNVFKNYAKMPGVKALGQTAALVNIPLDRVQRKTANLIDAVNYAEYDLTTTAGLLFGHSLWTLQSEEEKEVNYAEQKARRKEIKSKRKTEEETKDLSATELRRYDLKKLRKEEQVDILYNKFKLTKTEINRLTKEKDRINKIMSLEALDKSKKRKDSLK